MIRTLVLNDGTEIMMEDNSTIRNARVLSASKAEMVSTWDKFTNANLKKWKHISMENFQEVILNWYWMTKHRWYRQMEKF